METINRGTKTGRMYTYMGYTLWWHDMLGRWIASKDGIRHFTDTGIKPLRDQIYKQRIAAEKKARHGKHA